MHTWLAAGPHPTHTPTFCLVDSWAQTGEEGREATHALVNYRNKALGPAWPEYYMRPFLSSIPALPAPQPTSKQEWSLPSLQHPTRFVAKRQHRLDPCQLCYVPEHPHTVQELCSESVTHKDCRELGAPWS